MKTILLQVIFLLSTFSAFSQEVPSFTYLPKAGETYYSLRIDTNIKESINFSPLDFSRSRYSDTLKCDVSQDLRISTEEHMKPTGMQPKSAPMFTNYKVKGDTLSITGNGQSFLMAWEDTYTDPEVLFTKKDISYGSISGTGPYTFSDSVKGTSTSDVIEEHPTFKFLTTTTADGVGKAILPGGIPYNNLTRVKIERKFSSRTSVTYWYFKPGINTFPILEQKDGGMFYNTQDIITSVPSHSDASEFSEFVTPSNSIICSYAISSPTRVVVTLVNTTGQVVATPINHLHNPGTYNHPFPTSDITDGLYFINFMTDNAMFSQKIVLHK